MANYADIKGQISGQLNRVVPVVSIPVVDWEKVVFNGLSLSASVILSVYDAVTSESAKSLYRKSWAVAKWIAGAIWSLILVSISLVVLLVEAWQNRKEVKESAISLYKKAVQIADMYCFWVRSRFADLRMDGLVIVQVHVIDRVEALKTRFQDAARVLISDR